MKLKFQIKNFLINGSLAALSFYLPLFLYSCYHAFSYANAPRRTAAIKAIREERKMKIEYMKKGYLPVFFPNTIKRYSHGSDIYPVGSLPYANTYWCNEGYGIVNYKTDRFGLRNPDQKWKKVKNKKNIFLIGDSFIHGACVSNKNTISEVIEKNTSETTFNLGTGSNGPYEYQSIIKNLVEPIVENSIQKNVIILSLYTNDNWPSSLKDERLLKNSKPIVKLSNNGDAIPIQNYKKTVETLINKFAPTEPSAFFKSWKRTQFKSSVPYTIITIAPIRNIFKNILRTPAKIDINGSGNYLSPSLEAIKQISEICKKKCSPHVVFIPNSTFWDPDLNAKNYKNKIRETASKYNVNFVDGQNVIDQNNLKDYAPYGAHLSIDGYEKLSNLITKSIEKSLR